MRIALKGFQLSLSPKDVEDEGRGGRKAKTQPLERCEEPASFST